ncbi:hypothetical protein KDM87_01525 [Undibacterium sp. FT147W]|uniref:Uncharacterized protein n=1 Tax=Undibacterium rivi TaxID=2828729 RepID=A0ABS5GXT4_9BURK|nr:hypothetical protein [Undibacterium rivi]MBR7791261.1 hypothetical protein [Undibacterium rivi]
MENIMMLATALGIVGGGLCAYMACKSLVLVWPQLFTPPHFVMAGAVIGALIILLPSVFFALVVGGNLGGALGDIAESAVGWGTGIVPVGLALGIAAAFSGSLIAGSLIGSFLGKALTLLISYSMPR